MTTLISDGDVHRVVTAADALEAMRAVYRLDEELVGASQRMDVPTGKGWLRVLSCAIPGLGVFGYKALNLAPGTGVRYMVTLYGLQSGELLAVADAQHLTTLRTSACSVLACELMVGEKIETMALIGTGVEARAQLKAFVSAYPDLKVNVFSRNAENRRLFIDWAKKAIGSDVTESESVSGAVKGAEVITLATKSSVPVLAAELIVESVHVNSVGSARRDQFELEPESFSCFSNVVCDSPELVFAEAGDAIAAIDGGKFDVARAHALGALVRGEVSQDRPGPTLFKSVGTAVQDVALLAHALPKFLAGERQYGDLPGFPSVKATV